MIFLTLAEMFRVLGNLPLRNIEKFYVSKYNFSTFILKSGISLRRNCSINSLIYLFVCIACDTIHIPHKLEGASIIHAF